MKRRPIFAALAAALTLVLAATAFGAAQTVRVGNLYLVDNGGIVPNKLPRHESAPIGARLEATIGTVDGSHPPALTGVELAIDRTIGVDAVGLPACSAARIVATSTATAKRLCGDALVGRGDAEVEVAFPEQAPFSAQGPVLIFNGGVRGATTRVLLHAYVDVPAPTAIVVSAELTRIHRGRYGLAIEAAVPRIAGGAGSVTRFRLWVARRFVYRGRRRSFLTASCPTGSFATKGQVSFSDGTRLGETHLFRCKPEN